MLLQEKLKNTNIILASQSPRRRELLAGLGLNFETISLDIDESFDREIYKAEKITEYLSAKKANAYNLLKEGDLLITSDTTVWANNMSLEKPENRDEAFEIIKILSDNTHQVFTSVTLKTTKKEITFTDVTKVSFSSLTDEEIYYYIDHYKP